MESTTKLVIFDFDGTLADTRPFMLSVAADLTRRHNTPFPDEKMIEQMRGYTIKQIMEKYQVSMWKILRMGRDFQQLLYENIGTIKLFPGIETVIRTLADKNIAMAVVTSNQLRNVIAVLGDELSQLVSFFECEAKLFSKSAKLKRVLRLADLQPADALSLGDETRDIEAAKKSGIPCAAVDWGYNTRDSLLLHEPNYLLTSVDEILKVVFR